MVVLLPLLIVLLVLSTLGKGRQTRKGDLGFVVVILVVALMTLGARF